MNQVILIGRLGADPELRSTPSGASVATAALAVSRRWRDRDGKKHEATTWVRIEAWSKTAELLAEYCSKGDRVGFVGRLDEDRWEDKTTGDPRHRAKVVVREIEFLQDKRSDDGGGATARIGGDS